LNPSNILVTVDGVPKLLDFGVAKWLAMPDSMSTQTLGLLATPEYASPEQLAGRVVSTATDVYSLGVILYELLTGVRPSRENVVHPSVAMRADNASWWKRLRRQFDPKGYNDLDAIILKALQADPGERYQSVEQFADDLGSYLHNQPVFARPATIPYRMRKFMLRHRLAVGGSALVVIALAAATGWALYQTRIALQDRTLADQRFREAQEMTNTLLYDVYDEIAPLSGATKVRENIVKKGIHYLDVLSTSAGRDTQLRYELAAAYRRLALLQGHPMNANRGDFAAALATIRKAILLQQTVPLGPPHSFTGLSLLAELLDDEAMILVASGKAGEARSVAARGIAIADRVANALPTQQHRYDLALQLLHSSSLNRTVDLVATGAAQMERSLQLLDQLAAEGYSAGNFRTQHAYAHMNMGALLAFVRRDYENGRRHHLEALKIDDALSREHPENIKIRYSLTFTESDIAAIDAMGGNYDDALAGYQKVLVTREAILAMDPTDERTEHGVISTCQNLSDVLKNLKRYKESLSYLRRALEISNRFGGSGSISIDSARSFQLMGGTYLKWAKETDNNAVRLALSLHYLSLALPVFQTLAERHELLASDADRPKQIAAFLTEIRTLRSH
jgi:tetratricopeptide (TPR) repeat protein